MPDGAADFARAAPVVVVLHPAADVERDRHVVADVVEEPDRQVGQELPVFCAVVRHGEAAIVANQHVLRVGRVDPDRMDVVVCRLGDVGRDGPAAVERLVQADTAEIDHFRVARVDVDLAEVHRPRVGVVDLAPGRARVVGAIHPGGLVVECAAATAAATRRRRRRRGRRRRRARSFLCRRAATAAAPGRWRRRAFDQRVENLGLLPVDVDRDAPERSVEDAALQLRPGLAAVGRLEDAAAGAAAVEAALRPPPLIHRRVEDLAVRRIDRDFVRAGVVVDLERLLPGLAAVGRLEDAALAAWSPQAAGRRDKDDIVVARVDDDAVDEPGVAEAEVGEGLAAVSRLVDAVAPRHALTIARFAGADPDEIRVRLRDRDVANRERALILHQGFERGAVVDGFPQAAVRRPDVVVGGIGFVDREVGDTAGHRRRSDRAEAERVERRGRGGRGRRLLDTLRQRSPSEHHAGSQRHGEQSIHLHRQRPPGFRERRLYGGRWSFRYTRR